MRWPLTAILVLTMVGSGAALGQGVPEPGTPRAMFQQLPLVRLGGEALGQVTYANLALQAETTGVAVPTDDQDRAEIDEWLASLGTMMIHSRSHYFLQPEWDEFFGFDLFDLDQVVEYAAPPAGFSLFRGRFEADDLVRHWQDAGYQARETETGTYYTIGDDFEIDMSSPSSRLVLASANYLALLGADTIAFASTERLITEALDLAAGGGTSFADELNIASMLEGVPDTLASGLIVAGTQLQAVGDPAALLTEDPAETDVDAIATRLATEAAAAAELPPISVALLGSTAGGPLRAPGTGEATPVASIPAARAVAIVVTTGDAAARTAAEVIDTRLAGGSGGLTWAEIFSAWVISVVEEEPVVVVELELAPDRSASILTQMLYRRELAFLAWLP